MNIRTMLGVVIAGVAAAAWADDSWPVRVLKAPGQPIVVTDVRTAASVSGVPPDLVLVVANASNRSVRSLRFTLAPADCSRSNHPAAYWVTYGDPSAFSKTDVQGGDAPLAPGASAQVRVAAELLRRILDYQRRAGCVEGKRPELVLRNVAFCDNTGWQGVAGESPEPRWQDEPWAPATPSRCHERA
jgi:hypothetical protein